MCEVNSSVEMHQRPLQKENPWSSVMSEFWQKRPGRGEDFFPLKLR